MTGEKVKTIINNLVGVLHDLFFYVEIEGDIKPSLKHYQRYYRIIKYELENEYAQTKIETLSFRLRTIWNGSTTVIS